VHVAQLRQQQQPSFRGDLLPQRRHHLLTSDLWRWRASKRSALLAAVVIHTLSACTGDTTTNPTTSVSTKVDRARSGLPIESVLLMSDSDQVVLNDRLVERIESCMQARGFSIDLPRQLPVASVYSLESRYGAIPNDNPSQWGYRNPNHATAASQTPLTDAEAGALYGATMVDPAASVPDQDGVPCFPKAMSEVYGNPEGLAGLPGYSELVQLQIDSNDRLYLDPRGQAIVKDWSKCMSAVGFDFANWWEAPASFSVTDPTDLEDISQEERNSAQSDAQCRQKLSFEEDLLAIESELQAPMLEEHAEALQQFQDEKARLVDAANNSG